MKLNKILVGFVLQDGLSPLHMASQEGHLDVVKTLIEVEANINQADKVCMQYVHMYDNLMVDDRSCYLYIII